MYKLFILITSLSILATAQAAGAAPEEQITAAPQPMSMSSAAGNPRLHEAQYAPALQYTALLKLHQDRINPIYDLVVQQQQEYNLQELLKIEREQLRLQLLDEINQKLLLKS
ncbi:MAG: hypothetical protein A3I78_05680 [Gammaproteobacteria bacterium RIFCSPLOWO2_02_FULL_56_15]|nr:MAG: hypothetical protein A3I78_05680 [Gammaproteobacteria bacterium RIFCSPLOWO2_02_FULL_56_15]